MSRRHQSSRRKTYGRRQHELRERHDRRPAERGFELELDDWRAGGHADPAPFVDPRFVRIQFVGE